MLPKAKWSSSSARVGELVTFDFNVGALDSTVSGTGAPTRAYTADRAAYTVRTKFPTAGTVTWTVTNRDGTAEASIVITD